MKNQFSNIRSPFTFETIIFGFKKSFLDNWFWSQNKDTKGNTVLELKSKLNLTCVYTSVGRSAEKAVLLNKALLFQILSPSLSSWKHNNQLRQRYSRKSLKIGVWFYLPGHTLGHIVKNWYLFDNVKFRYSLLNSRLLSW